MITLEIDVTLLDKNRFTTFQRKTGENGKSCKLILFEAKEKGKFYVKQNSTKEEREKGIKLPILGNGTDWSLVPKSSGAPGAQATDESENPLPF